MTVSVDEAHEVDLDLVSAFTRLVPQLSSSSQPPTADDLAEVIADPGNTVFVARADDGRIVGTTTLATFRIPTGMRAWIEDVVVDEAARGLGAAKALTAAALDKARSLGCRTVDLTSRPSREAANQLYKTMGFEQRDTNVYRFTLDG
ncbi:MAG TPA: GNAT family N-acetyltransferase [Acidimicrobiales bacterium]